MSNAQRPDAPLRKWPEAKYPFAKFGCARCARNVAGRLLRCSSSTMAPHRLLLAPRIRPAPLLQRCRRNRPPSVSSGTWIRSYLRSGGRTANNVRWQKGTAGMSVRVLQRWEARMHLRCRTDRPLPGQDLRTAARSHRPAGGSACAHARGDRLHDRWRSIRVDPRPRRSGTRTPARALPPFARGVQCGDEHAPDAPFLRARALIPPAPGTCRGPTGLVSARIRPRSEGLPDDFRSGASTAAMSPRPCSTARWTGRTFGGGEGSSE